MGTGQPVPLPARPPSPCPLAKTQGQAAQPFVSLVGLSHRDSPEHWRLVAGWGLDAHSEGTSWASAGRAGPRLARQHAQPLGGRCHRAHVLDGKAEAQPGALESKTTEPGPEEPGPRPSTHCWTPTASTPAALCPVLQRTGPSHVPGERDLPLGQAGRAMPGTTEWTLRRDKGARTGMNPRGKAGPPPATPSLARLLPVCSTSSPRPTQEEPGSVGGTTETAGPAARPSTHGATETSGFCWNKGRLEEGGASGAGRPAPHPAQPRCWGKAHPAALPPAPVLRDSQDEMWPRQRAQKKEEHSRRGEGASGGPSTLRNVDGEEWQELIFNMAAQIHNFVTGCVVMRTTERNIDVSFTIICPSTHPATDLSIHPPPLPASPLPLHPSILSLRCLSCYLSFISSSTHQHTHPFTHLCKHSTFFQSIISTI